MELKKLDFKKKEFKANGTTYYIESELSIDRFRQFEKLQSHVGFGIDFEGIVNRLKDAYEYLNKSKPADAAIVLHNVLNGIISNIEGREHPIMELCALFINTKDEKRDEFNQDDINKKIADWKEYAVNDFFQLAFNLVDGFIPIYEEISQNISKKEKNMKPITAKG